MAVDVADERLDPVVDHLDGPAGSQSEHAGVDVKAHVLARPEGAAHADRVTTDLVRGEPQTRVDLLVVDVRPLADRPQIDTALTVRNGETGLRTERSLVLAPDFVVALHGDRALGPGFATLDRQPPEHRIEAFGLLGVGQRRELLPLDVDGRHSSAGGVLVVGGDHGNGLAPEPRDPVAQHRLVLFLHPEHRGAGHVLLGEDRLDPRHRQRRSGVDPHEPGVGVRAAQRGAPQHVVVIEVRGIGIVADQFGDAVGPQRRLADVAAGPGAGDGHGRSSASASRLRKMAPYPVQRQMLPASASRISSRCGDGFASNR